MTADLLIILYCTLIATASLLGGSLPSLMRLTHVRMQMLMSLVGGLMMGVAILHLLPHAATKCGMDEASLAAVCGLLVTFLLIRFFAVHQHGHHAPIDSEHEACDHDHGQHHDHADHDDHGHHHEAGQHAHAGSWLGLFIGLAVHTAIDGVALAASVGAEAVAHAKVTFAVGMGTFVTILLHKPLDSLSITSVMTAGKHPPHRVQLANIAFAITCPLGALLFYFGVGGEQSTIVGWALGFAAGSFLCISLADILPEVQFHSHDRLKLTGVLMVGVALAYLTGLLEPKHLHGGPPPPAIDLSVE